MDLHPAENRGYRELYLTGRQTARRISRLAPAFAGRDAQAALRGAADSIRTMLDELRPLTAAHDLYSRPAAEGTGSQLGALRSAIADRFLERNQALRLAVSELEHLATLLAYLGAVGEGRGDPELPGFCRGWERRLRRRIGALRRAAVTLGEDPDFAVQPLDPSLVGRAAHGLAWGIGTLGEWTDRQAARRKRD